MTKKKRDFFDDIESLMDQGYQVAIPVDTDDMNDIRRTMKKSIEDYKANMNRTEKSVRK